VKLKNESNLFATKSNLSRVYAYVYISLLGFRKEIKIWLEFFLYSNLKKNNGHWGLSIAYILHVIDSHYALFFCLIFPPIAIVLIRIISYWKIHRTRLFNQTNQYFSLIEKSSSQWSPSSNGLINSTNFMKLF
jgi:hypothetical protein